MHAVAQLHGSIIFKIRNELKIFWWMNEICLQGPNQTKPHLFLIKFNQHENVVGELPL